MQLLLRRPTVGGHHQDLVNNIVRLGKAHLPTSGWVDPRTSLIRLNQSYSSGPAYRGAELLTSRDVLCLLTQHIYPLWLD